MLYTGIQKLSLVDFDSEVSTTLFTGGCNFRCPFCHNFEFVIFDKDTLETIKDEDIYSYLESRKKFLTAVAITGGEPTLNKDLKEAIIRIKNMGYKIKLDSNGTNPEMVIDLIENHLIDYLAMDIKNTKEKYPITIGLEKAPIDRIDTMINYLISHDFPFEFRTTLIKGIHEKEDFEEIGKWVKGTKKFVLQRFVLSDNVPDRTLIDIATDEAFEIKKILEKYIPNVLLRGY